MEQKVTSNELKLTRNEQKLTGNEQPAKRFTLVQRLADKHKIYWAWNYIIPQTFADIDYLLNYIKLKLL